MRKLALAAVLIVVGGLAGCHHGSYYGGGHFGSGHGGYHPAVELGFVFDYGHHGHHRGHGHGHQGHGRHGHHR